MNIYRPGMAYIGRIVSDSPIEGADRIHQVEVVCGEGGRWRAVTGKDLSLGMRVVVFLPDAVLPPSEAYSFMEKQNWRVKTTRFKGCPSEVLVIPVPDTIHDYRVGVDVTDALEVLKYEKPVPLKGGEQSGPFPSFVPKTDEISFQKAQAMRDYLKEKLATVYSAIKYDGTSQTFYHLDGRYGACSRNWEMKEDSLPWQMARQYGLHEKLSAVGNIALQWECVGPKIQGNPLGLSEHAIFVFDGYDIDKRQYLPLLELQDLCLDLDVPQARVVELFDVRFDRLDDDVLREVASKQVYPNGSPAEGIVIRPIIPMRMQGERVSFKVINSEYKEAA